MFNGALCKSKCTMFLLLLGVAFLGSPVVDRVFAAPVTFSFTGDISSISSGFGTSQFGIGDTVFASFTFDPATSPTFSSTGEAIYDAVITSYTATTSGGYSASATTGQIAMWDNGLVPFNNPGSQTFDEFRAGMFSSVFPPYTITGAAVDNVPLLDFVVALRDPTQTAFSSTDLPSTLDLSKFNLDPTSSAMQFLFGNSAFGPYELVNAQITNMTTVPEPTTLLLLAFGLVGAAGARRRLQRQTRLDAS